MARAQMGSDGATGAVGIASGAAATLWELLLRQEPVLGLALAVLLLMLALTSGAAIGLALWLRSLVRHVFVLTERAIGAIEDASHAARSLEESTAVSAEDARARWDRITKLERALAQLLSRRRADRTEPTRSTGEGE